MISAEFGIPSSALKNDTRTFSKASKGPDIRNLRMRIVRKSPNAPRIPNLRIKNSRGKLLTSRLSSFSPPGAIAQPCDNARDTASQRASTSEAFLMLLATD
jgi:hypothetical protein